jgi:hypothetical protein
MLIGQKLNYNNQWLQKINQNIRKPNNLKVFGSKETKGLKPNCQKSAMVTYV